MEFKSNKNGRKFGVDGYIYNFDKALVDGETLSWRCERKDICCARIHTRAGAVVKTLGEHATHDSDPAKIFIKQTVSGMKRRASETDEAPSQIMNASLREVPDLVLGMLPTAAALKKTIRYVRGEFTQEPPSPANLNELVIPESYKTFKPTPETEENFLLADSGPGPDRVLVFGRERNIDELKNSKTWFVDGTFSITPAPFYQVFLILAEKFEAVHPFFYVLLPGKSQLIYIRAFVLIKSLHDDIAPSVVHCDFELATHKALSTVFSDVTIYGCFFHLMSNMRKHVDSLKLTTEYRNDLEFAIYARMIMSVAFLPLADIEDAVEALSEKVPAELSPLLNWFEDTYVGRPTRRGGRQSPRFPPAIWSVHRRIVEGGTERTIALRPPTGVSRLR